MEGIAFVPEGPRVYLTGNTYPVKDAIKSAGGHWDGDRKQWWIGLGKQPEVEAAIAKAPAPTPGKCRVCGKACDPKYETCYGCKPRPKKCKLCGAVPDRRGWPRIYKNGVCSNCYSDMEDDY